MGIDKFGILGESTRQGPKGLTGPPVENGGRGEKEPHGSSGVRLTITESEDYG